MDLQLPQHITPFIALSDLLPDRYGVTNNDIFEWRLFLKQVLVKQRKMRSDYSGSHLYACHMHEGIVTRGMVPKSIDWHYRLFVPWNCVLLLPEEHIPQPPSRDWCIQWAYEKYGIDTVRDWYYNTLQWKVVPSQLP